MSVFEPYLAGWRERHARQRAAEAELARRAVKIAERLARILVERYGAHRVFLAGSLARGDFGEGSDIDLAAEGIPPDVFFAAGAELEAAADGFAVDLVPLESATPAFLEQLAQEGVRLE